MTIPVSAYQMTCYKYLVANLNNRTKLLESNNPDRRVAESKALHECKKYYDDDHSGMFVNTISSTESKTK